MLIVINQRRACVFVMISEKKKTRLRVGVAINGVDVDVDRRSVGQFGKDGFGLFDIREKIKHLGGCLKIHSTPGSGTRIGLSVPLKELVLPDLKN